MGPFKLRKLSSCLLTILIVWVAFDSAVLIHEWTHGFIAWLNNAKSNPFNIYYGDWTLLNVDEDVDYASLLKSGKNWAVAFIAITPSVINLFLATLSFFFMKKVLIQQQKRIYKFLFFFSAFNLSEFFSYIPIRTFTTHADVYNFNHALSLPPWVIGVPGAVIAILLMTYFFLKVLPVTYSVLHIDSFFMRLIYLSIMLFIFFFMGGCRGLENYGQISATMGVISLIMIPMVFALCFSSLKPKGATSK